MGKKPAGARRSRCSGLYFVRAASALLTRDHAQVGACRGLGLIRYFNLIPMAILVKTYDPETAF
jgi:hypothetical protein